MVLWQEATGHILRNWKSNNVALAETTEGGILWHEVVGVRGSQTTQEVVALLKIFILTRGGIKFLFWKDDSCYDVDGGQVRNKNECEKTSLEIRLVYNSNP